MVLVTALNRITILVQSSIMSHFVATTVPAGTNEACKYFVQNFLKHLFLVLVYSK